MRDRIFHSCGESIKTGSLGPRTRLSGLVLSTLEKTLETVMDTLLMSMPELPV